MGKKSLFCRIIQIAVLLALTASMCVVSFLQPPALGKKQENAGGEMTVCRNGGRDPVQRILDKRALPRVETVRSFSGLYGLEEYNVPEKKLDFAKIGRAHV